MSDGAIWKAVLGALRPELSRPTFATWIRPTSPQRVDRRWAITCVNALAQDWMEHRLGKMIRRELEGVVGEIVFRVW